MTPKERLEKILSERKKPLLIDNKVKRITPKSEFLLSLEKKQINPLKQYDESFGLSMENIYFPMFQCYTNTDRK